MKNTLVQFLGRFLCFLILIVTANSASAQVVLNVTGGQASGSAFFGFSAAFDDQPDSVPTVGTISVTGGALGSNVDAWSSPVQGYIDFGANFSNIVINQTWTAYKAYSTITTPQPFTSAWWSTTTDNVFDGGDILETTLNFGTQTQSYLNADQVGWTRDTTGLSITPQARYLVFSYAAAGTFGNNRVTELAVVGTVVPEPAGAALVVAGLGLLIRRRRSI